MIFRDSCTHVWIWMILSVLPTASAQVPSDTLKSWGKNQLRFRENEWVITNKKGLIISDRRFSSVEILNPVLKQKPYYLLIDSGLIALADHHGNSLTSHRFTHISFLTPTLLSFKTPDSGPLIGLINQKGEILQPPKYTHLFLDDDWRAIRSYTLSDDGRTCQGLISSDGKTLLEPIYKTIQIRSNQYLIPEMWSGKKGWFDLTLGKLLIHASLDSIGPLIDGYARVLLGENWGLIDKKGRYRLPLHFQKLFLVGEGRVLATTHPGWITSQSDTLYFNNVHPLGGQFFRIQRKEGSYLLRSNGDTLSGPQGQIGLHQEGAFWIFHQGLYHRKDTLGKRIDDKQYTSLTPLGDDLQIGACVGGGYHLLNAAGHIQIDMIFNQWAKLMDGSLWLQSGKKWRLYHPIENKLLAIQSDQPGESCNGGYRVNLGTNKGIMDQQGQWRTGPVWPEYSEIDWIKGNEVLIQSGPFYSIQDGDGCLSYLPYTDSAYMSGSLIAFRWRERWGLANEEGKVVFPAQANKVTYIDSLKLWQVQNDTAFGVMDRDGCFITSFDRWFDSIASTTLPFTLIKKQNSFGMIDLEGRLRISNRYEALRPFVDERAAFKISGKWGFINLSESIVVQPEYDSVENYNKSVARVWLKGYPTLIQYEGKILIDSLTIPLSQRWGFWKIEKNGKQGIIDPYGKRILPPIYDDVNVISQTKILVKKGLEFGLSDDKGNWILSPDKYAILLSSNGLYEVSSLPPKDYSFTFGASKND